MKSKIYLFLTVFFAVLFAANAQNVAGTYSGEVVIDASNFLEPLVQPEDIIVAQTGDVYSLKINQFTLLDPETQDPLMLIGDIEFDGLAASLQGENVVLSKAGISNGPVVYEIMPTTIELLSCVISPDGAMSVDLNVNAYTTEDSEAVWDINNIDPNVWAAVINVTVAFTGLTQASIFSPKADKLAVYPTVATDQITVEGFENAHFAIYNQNGALLKQGKLNAQTVNVSALNTGVYILNIGSASAIFIKK